MAQNGIHHVTAIAGGARRNLDFYTRTLGLRLVKRTVNFDDPGAYHLYYGDEAGSPGTILTFFPWEHAASGRAGVGELQETVFRIPQGAIRPASPGVSRRRSPATPPDPAMQASRCQRLPAAPLADEFEAAVGLDPADGSLR